MVLLVTENSKDNSRKGDTVIAQNLARYLMNIGIQFQWLDRRSLKFNNKKGLHRALFYPYSSLTFFQPDIDFLKYEKVIFIGPNWIVNNDVLNDTKFVYYTYDDFTLNSLQRYKQTRFSLYKFYLLFQSLLWRRIYKKHNCNIVFVSNRDRDYFLSYNRKISNSKVWVIKNGVRTKSCILLFDRLYSISKVKIGFFGNMSSDQSYDALEHLFNISKAFTNKSISIHIFGSSPTLRLLNRIREYEFHFEGEYNTVDDIKNGVDMCVFPMYTGTGIKNRVLESISYQIPFLVSHFAVGNDLNLPHEIIVKSKRPEDWVSKITELIENRKKIPIDVLEMTWDFNFNLLLEKMNLECR